MLAKMEIDTAKQVLKQQTEKFKNSRNKSLENVRSQLEGFADDARRKGAESKIELLKQNLESLMSER